MVLFVFINAIFNYYLLKRDNKNLEKITRKINPLIDQLDDLKTIIVESKMYTTNWVYLPNNIDDKRSLNYLHKIRYPKIKRNFDDYFKTNADVQSNIISKSDNLALVLVNFEKLIEHQREIIKLLKNFEDYENPAKKFLAEEIIEEEIIPLTKQTLLKLKTITQSNTKHLEEIKSDLELDSQRIIYTLIFTSFGLVFFVLICLYFITVNISNPVLKMKIIIERLAEGKLIDEQLDAEQNVIGQMAQSINKLSLSFKKTSEFANEIEKGNLRTSYIKLGDDDVLGNALLNMRDSLLAYSNNLEQQVKHRTEEVIEKSHKIEEQKIFYESILSNIPVEISVFNDRHHFMFINSNAVKNEEIRNELIGKDDLEYCRLLNLDAEFANKRNDLFNQVKQTLVPAEYIDKVTKDNGETIYVLRKIFPVTNNNNVLNYMIGFGIDITTNVEQSLKIEESLKEKETLLGEVHHRVKNNLAIVLGLIEMQLVKSKNDSLRQELSEVQHRISAMSLIHEKLYKTSNFAKIDLSDYLKDLVKFLSGFYSKGKTVKIEFDFDQVSVTPKKAIPIALIVNELITNSFKYAFNKRNEGLIKLKLKNDNENIILSVADDGPGLSHDFPLDVNKLESLGFKLLFIFTKQLKASYELENQKGLSISISFKNEQESFNS
jgi:two-component sensor histidine kinase/HAMP domain-containing protein